jgi:hypothetical protein
MGRYRISVPVYPAEPLEQEGGGWHQTALYVVTVDFTLPDPDDVVEIPIDQSSHIVPCPDFGTGFCIDRLDPDDSQSGCTLDPSNAAECPSFAPRRFRCDEAVPLPEECVDGSYSELGPAPGASGIRCCP